MMKKFIRFLVPFILLLSAALYYISTGRNYLSPLPRFLIYNRTSTKNNDGVKPPVRKIKIYIYASDYFDPDWGMGKGELRENYYFRDQHQFSLPQMLLQKLTVDFPELITNHTSEADFF